MEPINFSSGTDLPQFLRTTDETDGRIHSALSFRSVAWYTMHMNEPN